MRQQAERHNGRRTGRRRAIAERALRELRPRAGRWASAQRQSHPKFRFDAYDDDGIYLTAIGDAFIPQASGTNGATLSYVRRGERALSFYVDDDSSGCAGGTNSDGPGGTPYTCTGSLVDVAK